MCQPSRPLLDRRPRRRRPESRIADAVVEPDPIHSEAPARRILVAQVNPPLRGLVLLHIFEGVLHRLLLVVDAALLPLAVEADVERDGIVKRRRPRISTGCPEQSWDEKSPPPHRRRKLTSSGRIGNSGFGNSYLLCAVTATFNEKKSGGAFRRRRRRLADASVA